jgi:hypothetical protein
MAEAALRAARPGAAHDVAAHLLETVGDRWARAGRAVELGE